MRGARMGSGLQQVGDNFQVNNYAPTVQFEPQPSVAGLSGGGFVVVSAANGLDGSGFGVFAQLYDSSNNSVGSAFQVNTFTTGDQAAPSVMGLSNGGFV